MSTGKNSPVSSIPLEACMAEVSAATCASAAEAVVVAPVAPSAVIDLWPAGTMPGKPADKPEEMLAANGDGIDRIANVSHPTLSVFGAGDTTKPMPAMVICPGGGYCILAFNLEGTDVASWLASQGIAAVVLKYRVPANRDGAFQDVQRAMRVVRLHASEWGIDPARIGVMGFSAGGHLCARLSTDPAHLAYAAIDAADALACRPDFAVLVYPAYLEHGGKLAPELPVGPSTPPTLIVHTEDDTDLIAGSRVYHAALDAAGVANEFACYPIGGHGYGLRSQGDVKVWPQRVLTWLGKVGMH